MNDSECLARHKRRTYKLQYAADSLDSLDVNLRP